MHRIQILVALLVCSAPVVVAGQAPADLIKATQARDQAIAKVDVPAWERLTAPGFTVVNKTGHLLTRVERIAELKETTPADSVTPSAQEGITTFANGRAAVRRRLSDGVWWTEIWEKSGSGWRVVAVQGTPAAK